MPQGESFSSMRISGGGASLDLWCQIKADVMNIPVYALKNVDAADLGSSILVTVGAGKIPNFKEAIAACDLDYDEYSPNPENTSFYLEKFENFVAFERTFS
jgi:xylulokinase